MDSILSGQQKKPELYDNIGCDRSSSIEQITAEYRSRVRDCHPDKTGADSSDRFVLIQKAFDVLSDPRQRETYNMWLDSPLQMNFEEFSRNSNALKMSMHWVTNSYTTPQIAPAQDNVYKTTTDWSQNRYQSDSVRKFRNYEI